MHYTIKLITIAGAATTLVSCGTVSKVNTTDYAEKSYNKVIVRDFDYKGSSTETAGPASATTFPEYIHTAIRGNKSFTNVSRSGRPDVNTLVIAGDVTRYVSGNAAARLLIGMGAGSSYFDADVRFIDGATNKVIGTMNVDKNSWVLGGGIAAGQSPETFMKSSSKAVAKEAEKFSATPPTR